jgi:hypothetical protein
MDYGLTIGITQILQVYTAPSYAHTEPSYAYTKPSYAYTELSYTHTEASYSRARAVRPLHTVFPHRQESGATVRNRERG